MHIYNIGYGTYEESQYYQLYHERKFSKEEFDNIVIAAVINILKSQEEEYFDLSFEWLLSDVVKELVKSFGFTRVEFDAKFEVFGWADISDEKDWNHDRDDQLNMLTKAVTKEFGDSFKRKKEERDRRLGLSCKS